MRTRGIAQAMMNTESWKPIEATLKTMEGLSLRVNKADLDSARRLSLSVDGSQGDMINIPLEDFAFWLAMVNMDTEEPDDKEVIFHMENDMVVGKIWKLGEFDEKLRSLQDLLSKLGGK